MKDKKHLFLKLLCFTFLLGSTAAGGAACKDKPNEPAIPDGYDKHFTEVGSYYADEGETRNTFELTDSTFTLKLGGQTIDGTYLYNGTKLRLVTTDGTIIEATYSEATISFTYNGMSYTFIKNVEYTVKFEMNGGVAQADVKVLNGKKLDKATLGTPTKGEEGEYAFVGWYKDKDFKNEYSFDQPVTKDLKLYARFVKLLVNGEFSVTLEGYEGEDFAGKTEGRLLGALPALAAKDGAEFDGWWYSAYNDAAKLTAKMEKGADVKENLILYPVWKTAAPNVSVTEKEIITTATDGTVTIFCGEKQVAEGRITNGKYAYDFSKQLAGDYVITVKSKTEETKAYYKNKALARVSLFDVVVTDQGKSELYFNAVKGAEKYLITVTCGSQGHVHTDKEVKDAAGNACTVFDFTDCDMREGGMTFVVKAVAKDGYLDSVSEEFIVNRKLDAPANVSVDDATATLSWTAANYAKYYLLTIDGGETIRVDGTTYDVKSCGKGEHTFTVVAAGKGWNNSDVANYTWTKKSLASPVNLALENGYTITWSKVTGAARYQLKIDGKTIEVTDTKYTLTAADYEAGRDLYEISVCAIGSEGANTSLYSNTLFVAGSMEHSDLEYANGMLSWNPVLGIAKYDVKVNDGAVTQVTGTSAKITLTKDGTNVLYVRSYNAASVASAWVEKTVTAYTVSYDVGESEKKIADRYYAVGDGIDLPEADFTGYGFGGWFDGMNGAGTEYKLKDGVLPKLTEEGNLTLYAKWNPNEYQANFNVGEFSDDVLESATVKYKQPYVLPVPKSNDTNKAFTGWFDGTVQLTDQEGKSLEGRNWQYLDDRTLTAQWVEILEYKYQEKTDSYYVSKPAAGIKYLKELTIPETYKGKPVTRIESTVFAGCSNLVVINIPDRINEIETVAFTDCSALEAVNIIHSESVTDPVFYSADGVILKNDAVSGTMLYFVPKAIKGDANGTYRIPDGVATIPEGVFDRREQLKKIVVPASVVKVQAGAFYYARTVEEIEFVAAAEGEEEKALTLGDKAFNLCYALKKIVLPARVSKFNIFADEEDQTISGGYQQSVFRSCSALEEIHVIGKPATGKTAVYSSSENGLLLSADGKTLIFYPRGIKDGVVALPDSVTAIGDKAFYGNTAITEFVVPLRIVSIGASAFEDCSKLEALSFEGGEGDADLKIGERAFYACTSLKTLTLTENVRYLGRFAFGRTTKLEEVFVNSTGTVTFEDAAFAEINRSNGVIIGGGSGKVKTLHIGKGLANVDISSVFGGSSANLATVTVDPENGYYYEGADGVIYDKNINETTQQNVPTKILYYPVLKEGEYRVPDTISEIANNTFVGRRKLTKISIGNNITAIGDSAFDGCTGLQEVVWLPLAAGETENQLTIGDKAFRNCYNKAFTTFTLPGRVVSIGKYAFSGCDELTAFNFEEVVWSLEIGQLAFYGCDKLTEIVLPEKTISVGNGAFASCENLVRVVIPATAERLGEWVKTEGKDGEADTYTFVSMDLFTNSFTYSSGVSTYSDSNIAPKLAQVVVREGNKRYMSKDDMLYGKYADENDETTAGEVPVRLYYCPTAKTGEVTLPLTLKEIYKQAFVCNKGVTKIQFEQGELSGSLTIGENALLQAEKLTTFVLPNGLERIETGLFKNCTGLTTIEVPNTVKSIGVGAFENCNSLSNLTFAEGNDTLPLVLEDGYAEHGTYKGVFSYYSSGDYGESTIKSCKALTSIKFPKRLSYIGAYAFYYCENFATAEFDADSDLAVIGDLAFANTALSKIKLGSEEPVADESGIITMQLPKKITDIRIDAFRTTKLSNRTRLVIPKTVEQFGEKKEYTYTALGMFYHSELKEIVFEADSKLTTVGKQAFANAFGVNSAYKPTSGLTRVDFGDNSALETLPDSAFSNAQMLESVNFGANSKLNSLGRQAFQNCYKLKQVTLPATIQTLGDYAFSKCTDLASVTFETFAETNATGAVQGKSWLTSIGSNAFESTGLTSFEFPSTKVPLAVGALGETMFKNCKYLTTVKLSDTVTDITKVFDLCGSITKLEVPMENGVPLGYFVEENGILYNVVKNAAGEATTGTEIAYALGDVSGTFTVKEGITVLKASVFAGKANLKKVVLPQSLIEIEDKAFMDCFNLEEVTFAENCVLSELGESAFKNCIALKSIAIPNGVTKLNPYTFYNCRSLETVTLPNQLTHIGYKTYSATDDTEVISTSGGYVFAHCESLSAIDIPETVKFIQPYSFLNCKSLTKVEINVESGYLGEGAFAGCSALQEVVLCQGLQALPTRAFANCTSLSRVYTKGATGVAEGTADLSEILGFGYKNYSSKKFSFSMGTYTFLNCMSIREVKLSEQENFKALGNYTFDGCTNLAYVNKTNVSTDENAPEYISKFPDQMIYLGTYTFRNTALTSVRMPNSLRSLGSTAPSDTGKTGLPSGLVAGDTDEYKCTPSTTSGVFDGCTKLTKVDLNNVVRIGGLAFRNCPLTDVAGTKNAETGEIEGALDLSKVVVFGKGAFAGTGLKAVDLTGVWVHNTGTTAAKPSMGFGDGSFNSTTLETKADGDGVFENCKQLEKVTFSNKIGSDMLGTTKKTAKVELGVMMFKNCTALKKIELPKSTTNLENQLFYGCSALNEVVINGILSTFGSYAFAHCSALQSIDLSTATVTSISAGMFDGCTSLADVKLNPKKVATIYSYAFRDCASLVNEVPKDAPADAKISAFNLSDLTLLKQIGDYAFEGCGFTKVELGKLAKNTDVLKIGAGAFAGCANLTQVVLPENVMDSITTTTTTSISTGKVTVKVSASYGLGAGVFAGCPNLSKISVVTDVGTLDYDEDKNYSSSSNHYEYRFFGYEEKNGVIYRNTGDVVEIDGEEVRLKLIVGILESKLPADGVLTLKENERLVAGALDGITSIKKIVLPESMTEIDDELFMNVQGLEEVVISSKTTTIGESAFEGSSVKKVTYSGAAADAEGGLLTTRFPETLTQIGRYAFRYTKLQKVILPATLKNGTYDESTHKVSGGYAVGSSAFFGSELQSVVIEGSETYIDGATASGAFGNCEKLTDVQFLADTAFVGAGMFAGCTALQNAVLPKNPYFSVSGLTSVGKGIANSVFMGCTGLTSVVLSGDIIEIDFDAFKNCTNLTSVTLPEGVVTLGGFAGCEKLQSINIPSTVETIQRDTFSGCVALKQVVIPASVTSLKFSFDGWTADQTIYIEASPLVAYNQWASDDLALGGFCSFMKKDGSYEKEVILKCNAKIVWNYKAPAGPTGTEGK